MNREKLNNRLQKIKDKLIDIVQTRDRRIYISCESQNACDVCKFLFEDLTLRFIIATGIDSDNCFEVLYHFANDETGDIVTVKAIIRDRENPSIESITPFIPGAEWIEREIHDILGIEIKNHPNMRRLILHDDWPEGVYPLRKTRPEVNEGTVI
ncbi:MAG: NADH-quinone oxidoreductase subunit C [Sedimentisphaerales bacterium]|nr:NADH-quinone oxidoreductase subunit C [Sedimentisphaerales bacterium]